ncbi:serine protease, partial [Mycobacterium sp. 852014-52144_SCH5372336]|uniref:S1 family peptidase n=1 Tax=Mycobacterium sp. 852014-52144_SCH5372336 TaxID=1834115 RepID=UPI000B1D6598
GRLFLRHTCILVSKVRSLQHFQGDSIGPNLIIEAYRNITVQVSSLESPHWGSGLVLDEGHILTNKHVVRKLKGHRLQIVCPGSADSSIPHNFRLFDDHPDLDVAIIQVSPPALKPTPGMVFRDPAWADEVFVLGYPRVSWMVDTGLVIQRGEVVKPLAEVPAVVPDDADPWDRPERTKAFLYSAIARPGNSGGPVVAHDGRVIGIVHESAQLTPSFGVEPTERALTPNATPRFPTLNAAWSEILALVTRSPGPRGTDSRQNGEHPTERTEQAEPFYRGIPASEIRRALKYYQLEHLMTFEDPLNL